MFEYVCVVCNKTIPVDEEFDDLEDGVVIVCEQCAEKIYKETEELPID